MSLDRFKYYIITALLAVFFAAPVNAAVYADVSAEYLNIKVDHTRLHPWNGRIKLGVLLANEFAIEAHYASSIQDDKINSLKLEVSENKAVYARFQSPGLHSQMVVYLMAGYAWTTIKTSGAFAIPEQEFESFSWAIGAEEHMKSVKGLNYSLQYSRYYDSGDLLVEGISFGLRYDF